MPKVTEFLFLCDACVCVWIVKAPGSDFNLEFFEICGGAERPCPDGQSKWRFAQKQELRGLWMMGIAGENMAKRVLLEPSFPGN